MKFFGLNKENGLSLISADRNETPSYFYRGSPYGRLFEDYSFFPKLNLPETWSLLGLKDQTDQRFIWGGSIGMDDTAQLISDKHGNDREWKKWKLAVVDTAEYGPLFTLAKLKPDRTLVGFTLTLQFRPALPHEILDPEESFLREKELLERFGATFDVLLFQYGKAGSTINERAITLAQLPPGTKLVEYLAREFSLEPNYLGVGLEAPTMAGDCCVFGPRSGARQELSLSGVLQGILE